MKIKLKWILYCLAVISLSFFAGYNLNQDNSVVTTNNTIESQYFDIKAEQNIHYSYLKDKNFFEEAFQNLSVPTQKKDIKAIIVPHHLVAKDLIAENFNQVKTDKALTVFLMSPNHFRAGSGSLISSEYSWQTPYGILEPDLDMINLLKTEQVVSIDEKPFLNEHGISGIVPFIKRSLPNAKIVPIITKDIAKESDLQNFIKTLSNNLPKKYLFVASLDFCHNTDSDLCYRNDEKSLDIIQKFDYANFSEVDVDSPKTLKMIMGILEKAGYKNFELLTNTNSTKILNNPDLEEVVSYITGYFVKGEAKKSLEKLDLWFFGDMMLDRYVRQMINQKGAEYPFVNLKDRLLEKDLVIANLEGSFTDYKPKALAPNNMSFTFDPKIVPTLKKLNFGLFGLANNHSLNFGKEGLAQSREYLNQNQIDYFGDPLNQDLSLIKEIKGYKIGFVGYHEFINPDLEPILAEIKDLSDKTDLIIVSPHWGIEYKKIFSNSQQSKAHQFIDAGADIVIGHHPHVIQPIEIYKDRAIFYSLGNFIFDQTFSSDTQQGLSLDIAIDNNQIRYQLIGLQSRNLQVDYMDKFNEEKLLQDLKDKSIVSDLEDIKEFKLEL